MTRLLFANADWLVVCAAVIACCAAALAISFLQARRRSIRLFGTTEAVAPWRALSDAALVTGLLLVAIALLGPRIGHRTVSVSTAGVDAVVLLDVSRSMRAQDVPPSRLHRARRIAAELLGRLEPGDRAALAVYSGRGVVLTPLSPDMDALASLLPSIDSDLITPGGSKLRDGLERALEAFDSNSERSRSLVVLSDGEITGRSDDAGAVAAVRANTRVIGVALGSELGTTIPNGGAPLRDDTQRVVVSRRHRAPLQKLADATDGRLFVADEWGAVDLDSLTREVRRSVNEATGEWVEERRTVPLVLPFAALAFGVLWLESAAPSRLPRRRSRPGATGLRFALQRNPAARKAAIALAVFAPLALVGAATEPEREAASNAAAWEALAHTRSLDDRELLQLGVARARARNHGEALHAFRAVALGAADPAVAAVGYHDMGVLALERGDLEGARDAFLDALSLAPGDTQTLFNLEWTLQALAAQPPPQTPRPPAPRPRPDSSSSSSSDSGTHEAESAASPAPTKPGQTTDSGTGSQPDSERPTRAKASEAGNGTLQSAPEESAADEPASAPTHSTARPSLDANQREKWLQRVKDDPSRALRSAASTANQSRPSREPTW